MCDYEESVLYLLKRTAVKLNIDKEHDMNEKELAFLINKHFQEIEFEEKIACPKRKIINENGMNKKFKFDQQKVCDNLSYLELLPNEVYEKILTPLKFKDIVALKKTSKRLLQKTTLMDPLRNYWNFNANKMRYPPESMLKSDYKCSVHASEISSTNITRVVNIINRYSNRITSINIFRDTDDLLETHLTNMKPSEFPYLTSLILWNCDFDEKSLLLLAPQLECLHLNCIKVIFDLSSVTKDDQCFKKLKNLMVEECEIDVKKILTKCSQSLESFELHPVEETDFLEDFQPDLPNLNYLYFVVITETWVLSLKNIISKAFLSLRTLKVVFEINDETSFSTLLDQTLSITTLELTQEKNNIDMFINRCPLLQELTLNNCRREVNHLNLKDLLEITFYNCNSTCMTSVLKQASKSMLRTLKIEHNQGELCTEQDKLNLEDEFNLCDFPVISRLDKLWLSICKMDEANIEKLSLLFPKEAKVHCENQGTNIALIRRMYNIHNE